jgi:hypothetical protein
VLRNIHSVPRGSQRTVVTLRAPTEEALCAAQSH